MNITCRFASFLLFCLIGHQLALAIAADVIVNQTNTPGMFAEIDVNQDGANSVSMYLDIQDEPDRISGMALNSSATGDSSQNWSTAPLWTSVNPSDQVPEVGAQALIPFTTSIPTQHFRQSSNGTLRSTPIKLNKS